MTTIEETQAREQRTETIYAGEDAIKHLLSKLRRIKIEKSAAVGDIELRLLEVEEDLRQKSMSFDNMAQAIEDKIMRLMPEIARTVKTEDGAVLYRKASIRVSYDTKALDACTDDYVTAAILPYRKETMVKPSISIEVY